MARKELSQLVFAFEAAFLLPRVSFGPSLRLFRFVHPAQRTPPWIFGLATLRESFECYARAFPARGAL